MQGPSKLGPSRSTLTSGSLKEFGYFSYPFLNSPMLGPRAEDTAFIIPERGAETNWALVSGPSFGPDGKQGINWFYVASGFHSLSLLFSSSFFFSLFSVPDMARSDYSQLLLKHLFVT